MSTTPSDKLLSQLDPIDSDRLRASWHDSDAPVALLERTMRESHPGTAPARAAGRDRAPAWRPRLAVGLVASAAVALAILPGTSTRTATPAYAIRELPNGVIEVDLGRDFRDAAGLAQRLREFGIDVTIVAIPSSPTMVGRIGSFTGPTSLGNGFDVSPDGSEPYLWSIDPSRFRGAFSFDVGVAAEPGQDYALSDTVFLEGELLAGLHCAIGFPLRAEELAARLPAGVTATWDVATEVHSDGYLSQEVPDAPTGVVTAGHARNDHEVSFSVFPDTLSAGDLVLEDLADIPCTAADTARW